MVDSEELIDKFKETCKEMDGDLDGDLDKGDTLYCKIGEGHISISPSPNPEYFDVSVSGSNAHGTIKNPTRIGIFSPSIAEKEYFQIVNEDHEVVSIEEE